MAHLILPGSILDAPASLIVNPANSQLHHAGGLARVIDQAATTIPAGTPVSELAEIRERIGEYLRWHAQAAPIPVGFASLSPPGALHDRCRGIIHAVGPVWRGGRDREPQWLFSAFREALLIAEFREATIAVPAVSAGIFGVPIQVVAAAAVSALQAVPSHRERIFALPDPAHEQAFRYAAELAGIPFPQQTIDPKETLA